MEFQTIFRPWCIRCRKEMGSSGKTKTGIPRFYCTRCKRLVQAIISTKWPISRTDIIGHRLLHGWSSKSIAFTLKLDMKTVAAVRNWLEDLNEEEKAEEKARLLRVFGSEPPGIDARGYRKLRALEKDEKIHSLLARKMRTKSICKLLHVDSRRVKKIQKSTEETNQDRRKLIAELREKHSQQPSLLTSRNRENHPWRVAERQSYAKAMAKKGLNSEPSKPGRPIGYLESNKGGAIIPVAGLQKAFKKSGLSKCEIARRMGMFKRIPDIWKLNEMLGFVKKTASGKPQQHVTKHTALRLAKAMGASRFELGI